MKMLLLASLALAIPLASCGPTVDEPGVQRAKKIAVVGDSYVRKFCDHGRAIYAMGPGAVAIVSNAPECPPSTGSH